jgi:hypothetical protein
MARLTWKNVTAPDFSDAIQATYVGGNQIGKGFNNIGGAADDYRNFIQEQASNKAMLDAAQFKDSASWDAAMANGGEAGLNIAPGYATENLTNFVNDRRSTLLGNESTQAGTAFRETQNANAIQDQTQQNEDRAYKLEQRGIAADIDTRDKGEYADVFDLIKNGNDVFNMDQVGQRIRGMNLPADKQARLLELATKIGNGDLVSSPEQIAQTAESDEVLLAQNALDNRQLGLNQRTAGSRLLQIYDRAFANGDSSGDPMTPVLKELRESQDGKEGDLHRESARQIQKMYNGLLKDYPELGGDVIAQMIKENKKGRNWFALGEGELRVDEAEIRKQADIFTDPDQIKLLKDQRLTLKRDSLAIGKDKRALAAAQQRYNRATSKGNEGEATKAWNEILRIAGGGPNALGKNVKDELPPELQGDNALASQFMTEAPQSPEQRVASTNENLGNVKDWFNQSAQNDLQRINRVAGIGAGAVRYAEAGIGSAINTVRGLVNPEAAAARVSGLDNTRSDAAKLVSEGLLPSAGSANVSAQVQNKISRVAELAGLPQERINQVNAAVAKLQSGNLSQEEQVQMQAIVNEFLESSGRSIGRGGGKAQLSQLRKLLGSG